MICFNVFSENHSKLCENKVLSKIKNFMDKIWNLYSNKHVNFVYQRKFEIYNMKTVFDAAVLVNGKILHFSVKFLWDCLPTLLVDRLK